MIEFKITDEADQRFSTVVNNQRVTIRLWYAVKNDRWSADISIDGDPVLHGRKIVEGCDLLAAFDFNIGVIFAHSEKENEPGRDQLPDGLITIYHASQEEIDASVAS